MSFIHPTSKPLGINTLLLISILMISIVFQGQLFAQDIEKINHLKESLNEASANQKAEILKSISDEYKTLMNKNRSSMFRKLLIYQIHWLTLA